MSGKLRSHNTAVDEVVSYLRGEVGEIIFSWVLMRDLIVLARGRRAEPGVDEFADPFLHTISALRRKLEDEVVARLSELAEPRTGQLTFHFASKRLSQFEAETLVFRQFIGRKQFKRKRNSHMSHKELAEKWLDRREPSITYPTSFGVSQWQFVL